MLVVGVVVKIRNIPAVVVLVVLVVDSPEAHRPQFPLRLQILVEAVVEMVIPVIMVVRVVLEL